jgi:very-short-patch-repair endonuclease
VIGALADAQHGVVSRTQLLAAGVSRRQIERRLERGALRPVYRGVYAVGHAVLSREGPWMAAVLYGGEGAVLSHWSAATLWRMRSGTGPRTHVSTPRKRRSGRAITFHHAHLPPDEITEEQGIPVTTPARTLLDLAPLLPSPVLARMVEAAPNRGAHLAKLLDRYPRRRGAASLAAALGPAPVTRSDLEATMLAAMERTGLPRPRVNVVIEGHEVDFVWTEHRVIAELDTYVTHGSRAAFERDRERDRKLAIAGWTVVRITDERGVEDLRRLLDASAARSPRHRAQVA